MYNIIVPNTLDQAITKINGFSLQLGTAMFNAHDMSKITNKFAFQFLERQKHIDKLGHVLNIINIWRLLGFYENEFKIYIYNSRDELIKEIPLYTEQYVEDTSGYNYFEPYTDYVNFDLQTCIEILINEVKQLLIEYKERNETNPEHIKEEKIIKTSSFLS